jgi:two-component system alkaline phosphatase synthesis response regulator PhoP
MVEQDGRTGRIFIVDDDANIRKALSIILRKEHYEVNEFSSGSELREALESTMPQLIFLDVMMPPESGFDICAELKSRPATAHIPIFLVTARGMKQDVNKGFVCGADEYVLKPFFTKDVLQLALSYLRRQLAPKVS